MTSEQQNTIRPISRVTPENSFNRPNPSFSRTNSSFQSHPKHKITIGQGLKTIVTCSFVNFLLVFVPIGIASHFVWSSTVTFIMNFLAIIPLAKLLGFATEDIALRTGEVSKKQACFSLLILFIGHRWVIECYLWQRSRIDHQHHLTHSKPGRCRSSLHAGVHPQ